MENIPFLLSPFPFTHSNLGISLEVQGEPERQGSQTKISCRKIATIQWNWGPVYNWSFGYAQSNLINALSPILCNQKMSVAVNNASSLSCDFWVIALCVHYRHEHRVGYIDILNTWMYLSSRACSYDISLCCGALIICQIFFQTFNMH